jgi:sigma-B regulation protein RsbU (phosphoserine phosphatase)
VSRGAPIRVWATRTFSGRAIVVGLLLKALAFVLAVVTGQSNATGAIDTFGDIAVVAGALVVGFRLFVDLKQQLLWRVRRKLTVSYIFIGFVPALLIITFFLLCGLLLINNLSAHLIASRLGVLEREALLLARQTMVDLEPARTGDQIRAVLQGRQASARQRYAGASFLVLPTSNRCASAADRTESMAPIVAGPWKHEQPPRSVPSWIHCDGYAGVLFYRDESRREGERVPGRPLARAVAWPSSAVRQYAVIVDLPVTTEVADGFREETGVELREVGIAASRGNVLIESQPGFGNRRVEDASGALAGGDDSGALFRRRFEWFAFVPVTSWETGMKTLTTVAISVSAGDVYDRIAPAEEAGSMTFNRILLGIVGIVGGLFLIIQLAAFGMGLALARSITGSVHELFAGTERVRRGDFRGRVAVQSRDQLGELAESFNSMTSSIEDLLQQKAEKERLEQELRIARSIQMSLLPQGPMTLPGVSLTAHCEPAREVGGDYYDFLPIDDHTIGILVADVSGKGTSAALYMAELKGIMLSLCERYTSPRALLIEVDRIISRHLDSRSFITVSYLVMDVRAGTLRYARAGHCPLIYVPGPSAASRAPRLLTPDGLVLGLQLDEGRTFSRLLEEATLSLTPGDVFLLYTDGISEAMNVDGECFGDTRLAELVGQHADLPPDELRERILRDISAFAGQASQHDDMTMVLLRVEQMAAAENALTA